jgi:gluconolactonase
MPHLGCCQCGAVTIRVTTNIAFGGADLRDAFITLSMKSMLVQMRWDEPGMQLVYNG